MDWLSTPQKYDDPLYPQRVWTPLVGNQAMVGNWPRDVYLKK